MRLKLLNKKAFTLVEMLIVVVIIGILAAALIPKLTGAQSRARDTARIADANQIATALTMYFNDKGEYPKINSSRYCARLSGTNNNGAFPEDFSNYMPEIPKDPQVERPHYGSKEGSNNYCTWYYAYADLKNQWAEAGAAVIIINTENVGKYTNYILSGYYITGSSISDVTWTDVVDLVDRYYPDWTGDADTDDAKTVYLRLVY